MTLCQSGISTNVLYLTQNATKEGDRAFHVHKYLAVCIPWPRIGAGGKNSKPRRNMAKKRSPLEELGDLAREIREEREAREKQQDQVRQGK